MPNDLREAALAAMISGFELDCGKATCRVKSQRADHAMCTAHHRLYRCIGRLRAALATGEKVEPLPTEDDFKTKLLQACAELIRRTGNIESQACRYWYRSLGTPSGSPSGEAQP